MEAQLRRALLAAPLAAVAALAGALLALALGVALLMGRAEFVYLSVATIVPVFALFGVPTAYALMLVLVGLARVTQTSLSAVSFRAVAISAVVGTLGASYGLLWLADNLAEWWLPLCAAPAGVIGAHTFVTLRARAAAMPAAG